MAEEICVEMAAPPPTKPPFYRRKGGIITIIFLLLACGAGFLSWWLSAGNITSVAAEVDSVVITVSAEFPSKLERVFAHPGDLVTAGQPLARIDTSGMGQYMRDAATDIGSLKKLPGMSEISERLTYAQMAEKNMTARVARARKEEDDARMVMEDMVTAHVRAQLAKRSINPAHQGAWQQAAQVEAAAKARMEMAKAEYERASTSRAALDSELNRVRAEILRYGRGGTAAFANEPTAAPVAANDLYSPVPGKILRVNAIAGQQVGAGQPLFLIMPTDKDPAQNTWIQAWFPLDAADKIKIGQAVSVKFAANSETMEGKVVAVADEAQSLPVNLANATNLNSLQRDKQRINAVRYLPVRVSLDNPSRAATLQPGARAECQIQTRYILPGVF